LKLKKALLSAPGESELIKEFLTECDPTDGTVSFVDIKILVFNEDLVTLNIQRNTTAMEVYNLLAQVCTVCTVPYRYLPRGRLC
jgi:hypothetical protein